MWADELLTGSRPVSARNRGRKPGDAAQAPFGGR